MGVFDGTTWWLDGNHNYAVADNPSDIKVESAIRGLPIVGDFDGDGKDDLATWQTDGFQFDLAKNGFGQLDATIHFGFIGTRERPVAADMDQDGIDDVGLWVPDRAGQTPGENAEWYFLVSNTFGKTTSEKAANFGTVAYLSHAFTPVPFGKDLFASYGNQYGLPVVGNFDPPTTVDPTTKPRDPLDVNDDGDTGDDPSPWLEAMLEELDPADAKVQRCRNDLLVLHRQVADQLPSDQLGFAPLLPDDETPLPTRVGALAEWCEGFLFGLGLAGAAATRGGEEVREVIGDFSQIARAGMETGEGGEDDEVAYAELVEYLKVGAQTVHDGLRPAQPRRLH